MMAVEVKSLSDYSEKIRNVSHILTETLGTTTSFSFLEDTLRPFVKKNLKEYILNHWNDEDLVDIVNSLKKQAELELKEGWVGGIEIPEGEDSNATKEAIISYALSQMDGSNLASLNRLVVKDGYSKGQLKGHVFPDVIPAFKKWSEEGKKIYLYSSGMELSQKCLMSNTIDGDMTEFISGCFESSEYPPMKSESFRELCKKVDSPAEKVAFLTHNATTACAAHKAGLVVIMLSRDGNSYLGNCTRESFPVITSFEDISKQICGKRKAPVEEENTEGKRAKLDEQVLVEEAEMKVEEKVETVSDSKSQADVGKAEVPEVKDQPEEKMEVDEETKETVEKAEDCEVKIVVTPPGDDVPVGKSEEVKVAPEVDGNSDDVSGAKGEVGKVSEKIAGAVEVEKVIEKVKDAPEEVKEGSQVEDKTEGTVDKVKDIAKETSEKDVEVKQVIDGAEEKKETVEEVKEDSTKAAVEVDASNEKCNETVEVEKGDSMNTVDDKVDVNNGSGKAEVPVDDAKKVDENDKENVADEVEEGTKKDAVEDVKDPSSSEVKVEVTEAASESNGAPLSEGEKPKENGVSESKPVENGEGTGSVKEEKEVNGNGVMHINGKGDGAEEGDKAEPTEGTEVVAKKVETDNKVETAAEESA